MCPPCAIARGDGKGDCYLTRHCLPLTARDFLTASSVESYDGAHRCAASSGKPSAKSALGASRHRLLDIEQLAYAIDQDLNIERLFDKIVRPGIAELLDFV